MAESYTELFVLQYKFLHIIEYLARSCVTLP